jgi:GH3 auxin-responsive promoter family protein
VRDYTAAPHFFREEGKGRHDWLIEFEEEPQDIEDFANELDQALKTLNSDYEAKRYEDMTLRRLSVTSAPQGLFNMWLEAKGKLGGQNKIPRLCNTRKYIDELLLLQASERPSV